MNKIPDSVKEAIAILRKLHIPTGIISPIETLIYFIENQDSFY